MRAFQLVLVTVFAVAPSADQLDAADAKVVPIELAELQRGVEVRFRVAANQELEVEVRDLIPGKEYQFATQITEQTIPPLQPPSNISTFLANDSCSRVEDALTNLRDAPAESDVPTRRKQLAEALRAAQREDCDSVLDDARQNLAETTKTIGTFILEPGQRLNIGIERDSASWSIVLEPAPVGEWFPSYGFVFLPDENERFLAEAGDDGTTFTVTEKADRTGFEFVPSLFYSWMPWGKRFEKWNGSLTGGLGFDQSDPVVFLGGSMSYYQNISLLAGVAFHEQSRLRGEYDPGQELKQQIAEDSLVDESFRPNLFVGISFRFGSNPFSAGDPKDEPGTPTVVEEGGDKGDGQQNKGDGDTKQGDDSNDEPEPGDEPEGEEEGEGEEEDGSAGVGR